MFFESPRSSVPASAHSSARSGFRVTGLGSRVGSVRLREVTEKVHDKSERPKSSNLGPGLSCEASHVALVLRVEFPWNVCRWLGPRPAASCTKANFNRSWRLRGSPPRLCNRMLLTLRAHVPVWPCTWALKGALGSRYILCRYMDPSGDIA